MTMDSIQTRRLAEQILAETSDKPGCGAEFAPPHPDSGLCPRHAEVIGVLDTVMDPELDQSVVEMKFISAVTITGGSVDIKFRLPTYWCAANFAFLMASDMHAVVSALPWVKDVSVILDEHMYSDEINRGIAKRLSFADTFGDEADGNLDEVRLIFLRKAFQRRQEAVLLHLMGLGHAPEDLFAMTLGELNALDLDTDGSKSRTRYLERRTIAGQIAGQVASISSSQPLAATALAFVTPDGSPLTAAIFTQHMKALRSVRVNAEFNGALCSGLLHARYEFDTSTPLKSQQKANPFIAASPHHSS